MSILVVSAHGQCLIYFTNSVIFVYFRNYISVMVLPLPFSVNKGIP